MDVLVRDVFLDNEADVDRVSERLAERRYRAPARFRDRYRASLRCHDRRPIGQLPTLTEKGLELVPLESSSSTLSLIFRHIGCYRRTIVPRGRY